MKRFLNSRVAAVALAAASLTFSASLARAQDLIPANLTVSIDGKATGFATAAANLPSGGTLLHQNSDSTLPSAQVVSAGQGNVLLLTSDANLVSAMQAWMQADNSGDKDTVQRKTVRIDRTLSGSPNSSYRLTGAWPTKIESGANGGTLITIVFQSLAPVQ